MPSVIRILVRSGIKGEPGSGAAQAKRRKSSRLNVSLASSGCGVEQATTLRAAINGSNTRSALISCVPAGVTAMSISLAASWATVVTHTPDRKRPTSPRFSRLLDALNEQL